MINDVIVTSAEWEQTLNLSTGIVDKLVINGQLVACRLIYAAGAIVYMPESDFVLAHKMFEVGRAAVTLEKLTNNLSYIKFLKRHVLIVKSDQTQNVVEALN